jgi:hypothetical protein
MVSTVLTTDESRLEFGITQTDGGAAIDAGMVIRVSVGVGVGVQHSADRQRLISALRHAPTFLPMSMVTLTPMSKHSVARPRPKFVSAD